MSRKRIKPVKANTYLKRHPDFLKNFWVKEKVIEVKNTDLDFLKNFWWLDFYEENKDNMFNHIIYNRSHQTQTFTLQLWINI